MIFIPSSLPSDPSSAAQTSPEPLSGKRSSRTSRCQTDLGGRPRPGSAAGTGPGRASAGPRLASCTIRDRSPAEWKEPQRLHLERHADSGRWTRRDKTSGSTHRLGAGKSRSGEGVPVHNQSDALLQLLLHGRPVCVLKICHHQKEKR